MSTSTPEPICFISYSLLAWIKTDPFYHLTGALCLESSAWRVTAEPSSTSWFWIFFFQRVLEWLGPHTQRPATIRGHAYRTDILASLDPEFSVTVSMPFMGNMSSRDISKDEISQELPGSSLFQLIFYLRKSPINNVLVAGWILFFLMDIVAHYTYF